MATKSEAADADALDRQEQDRKRFKPFKAIRRIFRDGRKGVKRLSKSRGNLTDNFSDEEGQSNEFRYTARPMNRRISLSHDSIFSPELSAKDSKMLTSPSTLLPNSDRDASQGALQDETATLCVTDETQSLSATDAQDELSSEVPSSEVLLTPISDALSPNAPAAVTSESQEKATMDVDDKPAASQERSIENNEDIIKDMEAAVNSSATEQHLDNTAAYGKIAARPKNRRNKRKGVKRSLSSGGETTAHEFWNEKNDPFEKTESIKTVPIKKEEDQHNFQQHDHTSNIEIKEADVQKAPVKKVPSFKGHVGIVPSLEDMKSIRLRKTTEDKPQQASNTPPSKESKPCPPAVLKPSPKPRRNKTQPKPTETVDSTNSKTQAEGHGSKTVVENKVEMSKANSAVEESSPKTPSSFKPSWLNLPLKPTPPGEDLNVSSNLLPEAQLPKASPDKESLPKAKSHSTALKPAVSPADAPEKGRKVGDLQIKHNSSTGTAEESTSDPKQTPPTDVSSAVSPERLTNGSNNNSPIGNRLANLRKISPADNFSSPQSPPPPQNTVNQPKKTGATVETTPVSAKDVSLKLSNVSFNKPKLDISPSLEQTHLGKKDDEKSELRKSESLNATDNPFFKLKKTEKNHLQRHASDSTAEGALDKKRLVGEKQLPKSLNIDSGVQENRLWKLQKASKNKFPKSAPTTPLEKDAQFHEYAAAPRFDLDKDAVKLKKVTKDSAEEGDRRSSTKGSPRSTESLKETQEDASVASKTKVGDSSTLPVNLRKTGPVLYSSKANSTPLEKDKSDGTGSVTKKAPGSNARPDVSAEATPNDTATKYPVSKLTFKHSFERSMNKNNSNVSSKDPDPAALSYASTPAPKPRDASSVAENAEHGPPPPVAQKPKSVRRSRKNQIRPPSCELIILENVFPLKSGSDEPAREEASTITPDKERSESVEPASEVPGWISMARRRSRKWKDIIHQTDEIKISGEDENNELTPVLARDVCETPQSHALKPIPTENKVAPASPDSEDAEKKRSKQLSNQRRVQSKSMEEERSLPLASNVLRSVSSDNSATRREKNNRSSRLVEDILDGSNVAKASPPPWLAIAMEKQRRWGREEAV